MISNFGIVRLIPRTISDGCERLIRWAFQLASKRPRKFLTLVTKSNAQRSGLVLWDECAVRVAKEFPDVKWDKMLVDAMTVRMVRNPQSLDVICCTNLVSIAATRDFLADAFK